MLKNPNKGTPKGEDCPTEISEKHYRNRILYHLILYMHYPCFIAFKIDILSFSLTIIGSNLGTLFSC